MVETKKNVPPKKTPTPPVKTSTPDAKATTPTKGPEVQSGNAIAQTGGRGQGFGLSSGGGGTGGYLDVANFCCPDYLATMLDLINRNWSSRQQTDGAALIKFTIQRDGRLTDIEIERSSGSAALDLFGRRALVLTNKLPVLPDAFTEPTLTVHLRFEYTK
jgi:TonB family protein